MDSLLSYKKCGWVPASIERVLSMGNIRKRRGSKEKFEIALEALKGQKTMAEIASQYSIHPTMVAQMKKKLGECGPEIFGKPKVKGEPDEELVAKLYEKIGRLNIELDWLKKKVL